MARIAGIQIEKNTNGTPTHIRINLKKWGSEIEEFLDKMDIEVRKKETTMPWNSVKDKLDKKHHLKK